MKNEKLPKGVEKLPSDSYRVTKMYKGKRYRVIFDHKPTEKEITIALAEKMQENNIGKGGTFEKCARQYIENRNKVISPGTEHTYNIKINQLSDDFKAKNIFDIDNNTVQIEINRFAANHAPKTVKTLHGFISSVLRAYRPNLVLRTKLPQPIRKDEYIPNKEDILRLLDYAKGTRYHVPFQLAIVYGCRRSEICALSIDDLKGNELWIHCDLTYNKGMWVKKENPKTDATNRKITLPESLAQQIRDQGYIYEGHPNALNKAIHRYEAKLGIPPFPFHTLRKFFCSYSFDLGISEANIMSIGGWATPHVMKSVYRRAMEKSKKESIEMITSTLIE